MTRSLLLSTGTLVSCVGYGDGAIRLLESACIWAYQIQLDIIQRFTLSQVVVIWNRQQAALVATNNSLCGTQTVRPSRLCTASPTQVAAGVALYS